MSRPALRKSLSAPGLLSEVRRCFQALKDDTVGRGFQLVDYLMSGLAVFGLKYPSLLQFDEGRADAVVVSNLKSLYGIDRAPSDTASCTRQPDHGTGYFYSDKVHCEQCCEKRHRDGRVSWYHQLLGAVLVHPEQRVVLPLAPEPILREDGAVAYDLCYLGRVMAVYIDTVTHPRKF